MLCEHCKQHPATTHVRRTVNGKTTEYHLCASCAKQQGLTGGLLGGMGLDLGNFWGSLFAEPTARSRADAVRCEQCGSTFAEIAHAGKVGCPHCYDTFFDRLLPSIQRLHGKVQHAGKLPQAAGEAPRRAQELDRLKQELAACVERQEYERCATLRDQIRTLEQQLEQDGKGE